MSKLRDRLDRRRAEMARNDRRDRMILILVIVGFLIAAAIIYLNSGGSGLGGLRGPVDINTASAAQLDKLPEVGPAMAKEIVKGRPYEKVEDLLKVKGIGPKTLEKIKDLVKVE